MGPGEPLRVLTSRARLRASDTIGELIIHGSTAVDR